MDNMLLTRIPTAQTAMLIRRPVKDVVEALVNPALTTKFWFTKSSGRLEPGKQVRWEWEMYEVSTNVVVKALEPEQRLLIEWDGYSGRTQVEWRFKSIQNGTFVSVTESGFTGRGDQLVEYVTNSVQGFALMLAGMKAFLEHQLKLGLVVDRFPEGIPRTPEQPATNPA